MKQTVELVALGGTEYEAVAAGQTNQVLGTAGSVGDLLSQLVVTVTTSATGTVDIQDGNGTAVNVVPANTPIGVYVIHLGIRSKVGAWSITTGAGAQAIASGQFSI